MSVKRRDLIQYLEVNGFYLLREGGNHSVYTDNIKIPSPRRRPGSRTGFKDWIPASAHWRQLKPIMLCLD